MLAVVNYGAGNLRSVTNALTRLGCRPTVTADPRAILRADSVVFPGVGAAADTMRHLARSGLDDAIRAVIQEGRPLLAVCLGMQVLLSISEENGLSECLGVIPGRVKRLPADLKVPHMGWNQVKQLIDHPIFDGIPDGSDFYFVHSYYAEPEDSGLVAGITEYGFPICSVIIKDNLVATQFHPEKSGESGLMMYENYLRMAGARAYRA